MSWVPFTADHIKARMSAREVDVYEQTARAEYPEGGGAAEVPEMSPMRIDEIVIQICNRIRGAIQSNPRVRSMGAAGTIPEFCVADAAVLGRVALVGLNPVPEGMTDPRRDEYRSAEKFVESLRSIDPQAFGDPLPTADPSTTASFGGAPLLDF